MKKTLIALAAVAVSSAAMAQVTLSGKFGTAYTSAETKAGVKTSGFQVTDGDLRVTATEDLGNGVKATVAAEFTNRGRTASTGTGRDASLTLTTGFGVITAGAIEAANGIVGLGNGGAPTRGFDGNGVLDGGTNVDMVRFSLPVMTGLTAHIAVLDLVGDVDRKRTNINQLALTYSNGPLSIAADHADYKNTADTAEVIGSCNVAAGTSVEALANATATCTGGTVIRPYAAATKGVDARNRISASYDFGVAKVGYGYQVKTFITAGNKDDVQTTMGVSIPLGAITLGAVRSTQEVEGSGTKKTGNELGLNYAFSKSTNLQASYQAYKETGDAASTKYTRVRLMKSF
jgi:hypothetical protein